MPKFPNLAGIETTFEDFGLQTAQTIDLGKSLLVIGTAEDGPLLQPLAIDSLDDGVKKFGAFGQGSLVRGIFEAMNASNRAKDIRGMRIGNATKAALYLSEASPSGSSNTTYNDDATLENDGTTITDALILKAKKEGTTGNGFSIYTDTVNNAPIVAVYNPYTDITSVYSFSLNVDADVVVHNTKELADAINSDTNLEDYITATMKDLEAIFEVNIAASGTTMFTGVEVTGDTVYLTLADRLDIVDVGLNTAGTLPSGVHDVTIYADNLSNVPTAGNKIIELEEVYSITLNADASGNAAAGYEKLESKGLSSVELAEIPIGQNDIGYWNGSNATLITLDGATRTSSEAREVVVEGLLGQSLDGTTTIFNFLAFQPPEFGTITIYKTLNGVKSIVTDWTSEWLDHTGASETSNPTTGTMGDLAKIRITFTTAPELNSILTISYDGEWDRAVALTEYATQAALPTGDSASWTDYFVTGKTVIFGAAAKQDILVTYRFKNSFSVGGDVKLVDADVGKVMFGNPQNSPKTLIEAGGAGEDAAWTGAILGFRYKYQPEWVDVGSSAKSLAGGGDGITMSKLEAKESLEQAFDELENYVVDIIALKDFYLDDTMTDYNARTGLLETVNTGVAVLFCNFLDDRAEFGAGETLGMMATKPAASNALSDVNEWFNKLTTIDPSDPTRAANIMATLNCKWLSVTASEPVFVNARLSTPYVGTMESAYAGLIQALSQKATIANSAVGAFTTTNKALGGIVGSNFVLSNTQLDSLTGSRYVTLRNRPAVGLVVTDGVTTAALGSDYRRLSTTLIVQEAMEVVRDAAEPFIGEPNTAEQRDALDTAITRGLQSMVEGQLLRDFSFAVRATVQEQVDGLARVEMILVPAFEMRKIEVTVKLRPTL